jgi:hypothetical protein
MVVKKMIQIDVIIPYQVYYYIRKISSWVINCGYGKSIFLVFGVTIRVFMNL